VAGVFGGVFGGCPRPRAASRARPSARRGAQGACALDAQNVIKLLTFDAVDANRKAGHEATALSVHLPELVREYAGGEYSLFFANCQARPASIGRGVCGARRAHACPTPSYLKVLRTAARGVAARDRALAAGRAAGARRPRRRRRARRPGADARAAPAQPSAVVSFDLRVSLYNVRANGRRDYLAVGEDMLPTVYMVRCRCGAGSAAALSGRHVGAPQRMVPCARCAPIIEFGSRGSLGATRALLRRARASARERRRQRAGRPHASAPRDARPRARARR